MTPFRSDPELYKLMESGNMIGLSGGYVYDMLRTGSECFHELFRKIYESFQMSEEESVPCESAVFL